MQSNKPTCEICGKDCGSPVKGNPKVYHNDCLMLATEYLRGDKMPRMLDEVLSVTGDHHGVMPSGALVVYPSEQTVSSYYGLVDYAVSSRIAGGGLVMVARKHPKA